MLSNDPYKILGISPSATEDEAKAAYKKLAKKYHPDISTDPNASEIFNKISEAYSAVLERKKRTTNHRPDINIDDIFFNYTKVNIQSLKKINLVLTLEEAQLGCKKTINHGNKVFSIDIPPGQVPNSKLNFNVENSKLAVDISIHPDKNHVIEGINLIKYVKLTTQEFEDLNKIEVTNHVGKKFSLNLKSGMDTMTTLRVSTAGLFCSKTNKHGDLLIKLVVVKK